MSDLEFFSTIGAFVAGIMLLVYLFRIRSKLIKAVKLQVLKAMTQHNMPPAGDIWSYASSGDRELRK